jgi:hypothetical protein
MRHATLTVCGLLSLAALLAARPRVTFDELVGRVEALEGRVKALESPRPPPAGIAPRAALIRAGMSVAEAEAVLKSYGVRVAEKRRSDSRGRAFEHWDLAPARNWSIKRLMFVDGAVHGVDYWPESE